MTIADLFAKLKIDADGKSFDAADKMIGAVKSALLGLAAIAGTKFFVGLVEDTVDLGSHINDLAQSTGITTDTLQELGYAAKLNGSDMDSMAAGLGKLANNMAAAKAGGKEQEAAFRKLGVTVTDVHGKLRPVEDVFEDISIGQRKVTNDTEKGVAIFATLGKSGRALIPTMNDVADKGLANITAEARELGAVIDGETIAALDDFGDQQDRVKTALGGLKNTVVKELLPTLKVMISDLLEWVKTNRKMIAQKIKAVIEGIILAVKVFAKIVSVAANVVSFLADHLGILASGIMAVAAAMIIFKAESVAAALASAAAWLLAALPIVIVAAGLFAIILIIQDLYSWITGGDSVLKDFFGMFKTWIGEKLTALWDSTIGWLIDRFKEFIDYVVEKIEWVWGKIKAIGSAISDAGNTVFGTSDIMQAALSGDPAAYNAIAHPEATALAFPSSNAFGNSPTQNVGEVTIQVVPPAGANAKEIATQTKEAFDKHMATTLRNAKAGTGVR